MNNYFFDRKVYTVDSKSTMEITFQTMPNYFRIVNMGSGDLYFSVNGQPTPNRYDMKVTAGAGRLHAEPKGKLKAWVYNDSMQPVNFAMLTFVEEFDPMVLAYASGESGSGGSGGGGGGGDAFDGVIRGFNVSLPTGTNTIGRVDLLTNGQLTDIVNALKGAIPAGTNKIGTVDIANSTQLSNILAELKKVEYGIFNSGNSAGTGTTISATSGRKITGITFLSNDGEGDLSVTVGTSTFTLKAGEVLDNFKVYVDSVTILGNGIPYRLAYNEKEV